jgi:hypothetical protein
MNSDMVHLTKGQRIGVAIFLVIFIGFCVYGYFLLKEGQKKPNCWDLYSTENQAILHCEGVSQ